MKALPEWMEYIEDIRQMSKVRHKLKDILVIVLFATLGDADDWVEIEMFARYHEAYLRKYIELKNGIPSHDTIQRVMSMTAPEILQQLQMKWQELLNSNEGGKRTNNNHRCHGDTNGHSGKNPVKTSRLCIGTKGQSNKLA